jgi:hypothetical protein
MLITAGSSCRHDRELEALRWRGERAGMPQGFLTPFRSVLPGDRGEGSSAKVRFTPRRLAAGDGTWFARINELRPAFAGYPTQLG